MLCPGQDEIREEKSRQTLRGWWCEWVVWDDNKNVIYAKGFWTLTCSLDLVTREFILYFFLRATELPIMVARNIMKLYLNFTLTGSYTINFDNRCLFWLNFNFKVEKVEALLKQRFSCVAFKIQSIRWTNYKSRTWGKWLWVSLHQEYLMKTMPTLI